MLIGYSDSKTHKVCTNEREAKKCLGEKVSTKLFQRLSWLASASNLDTFNCDYNFLRVHKLKGRYSGSYAIDITKSYRLIFYTCDDNGKFIENEDFKYINVINIEEVSNHYED